jgi:hypothetical protein
MDTGYSNAQNTGSLKWQVASGIWLTHYYSEFVKKAKGDTRRAKE